MKQTKKVLLGVAAAATVLAACEDETALPPKPTDESCRDWDWVEEEGVWRCDETRSSYYRSYYYGGRYFKDKTALLASSAYQTYKQSASTKTSTGFGSGSTSFGG